MNDYYEIAGLPVLTAENSWIGSENGFPVLFLLENGERKRVGVVEAKRAFPFECENEFIVLEDEQGEDRGLVKDLSERGEEERAVLSSCLARRYFMPKITAVKKVNDRFGFCYFKVDTTSGETEFSVRDPYKSILLLGGRMIITDADGNRYEIPDVKMLKARDRKRIEQFLL